MQRLKALAMGMQGDMDSLLEAQVGVAMHMAIGRINRLTRSLINQINRLLRAHRWPGPKSASSLDAGPVASGCLELCLRLMTAVEAGLSRFGSAWVPAVVD